MYSYFISLLHWLQVDFGLAGRKAHKRFIDEVDFGEAARNMTGPPPGYYGGPPPPPSLPPGPGGWQRGPGGPPGRYVERIWIRVLF